MYYYFLAKNKLCKVANNRKGLGTVELVIILAVLVGLAIIFRRALISLLTSVLDSIFDGSANEINDEVVYDKPMNID
jgi:hypothetical protein